MIRWILRKQGYCTICRDHGGRDDRQKARLMWMVEELTVPKFREMVGAQMGGVTLRTKVEEKVSTLTNAHTLLSLQRPAAAYAHSS